MPGDFFAEGYNLKERDESGRVTYICVELTFINANDIELLPKVAKLAQCAHSNCFLFHPNTSIERLGLIYEITKWRGSRLSLPLKK